MENYKTAFNTLLAKPRVKSEHCIGILKGRFPFLRCIPLKLAKKRHMKRMIKHVRGTVVLHNFSIKENINWGYQEEDDEEEQGTLDQEQTDDEENDLRRSEVLFYLSELEETNIN